MASHQPTLRRSRRSHQSAKDRGAHRHHHRPLTDEQKADQNLQFMLSLYHSAAEPDGRPKQHRKFGSNTVRLLRPTASSVHYLPASGGEEQLTNLVRSIELMAGEVFMWPQIYRIRGLVSCSD